MKIQFITENDLEQNLIELFYEGKLALVWQDGELHYVDARKCYT